VPGRGGDEKRQIRCKGEHTKYNSQSHRQLGHAGSLAWVADEFLNEGDVEEGSIRVYKLEGEELGH
jgi:hypothetical protein